MSAAGLPRPLSPAERAVLDRVLQNDPADPAPSGILPVDAVIHDAHGDPVGAVLLRVRDGRLSAIEFAYPDDTPYPVLPGPDRLTVERPRAEQIHVESSPLGERVDPYDLAGRTLLGVTANGFHGPAAGDQPSLVHVWLDVEGIGQVMCHSRLALELYRWFPDEPYDMQELGRVTVGPVDDTFPLARFIGSRIDMVRIVQELHTRGPAVWCDIGMSRYAGADRAQVLGIVDDLVVTDGLPNPHLREV